MKRVLVAVCVAGFVLAIPLSRAAFAAPKAKVAICHVNSANGVFSWFGSTMAFGREIEVSENAVADHLAHGDSLEFYRLSESERKAAADYYEVDLTNADSWFWAD